MKKLLLFLGIFTFVLGVFLIVTGQFASDPARDGSGTEGPGGTSGGGGEGSTFIRYPHFDAAKGRLAVEFSGNLVGSPDLVALGASRPESARLQLRNGRIRVPLYATQQATEPGVKVGEATVREFVFEFEQAEGIFSRGGQTVSIQRGGRGRADDGTYLEFEELQLIGDGGSEWKASCGKRALLRREAMEIRAERGFVAAIDAAGLKSVEFQPPVRTFFLPGSEGLPFVVVPPVGGSGPREGTSAAEIAVCVRCAGPLSIDRDAAIVRYARQVEIFPVASLEEGLLEKLPPTHARCEVLTLQMDLGSKTLRGATVERGPNTPVQAFRADAQGGFNIEGDRLVWERAAGRTEPFLQGVTTLTGTPRLWGERWEIAAGRIRLDLDAGTADFEERVRGWFTGPPRDAGVGGAEPAGGLPAANVWDFQAHTAKAEFKRGAGDEPLRLDLDRITAYGAEGGEAGGIEVRSRDKIPVIAYGPILRCTFQDRRIRTISMDSSLSVLRPRFSYGQSWLTAGRVVLLEDEGVAILENDVRASVDAQAAGAASPTGAVTHHEIRAERARVTLPGAEARDIVIEGWGTPERELTMKVAGDPIFRLFGDHLRWEQATRVATLSGNSRPQRIELYQGELEASALRFDQERKTARADGKVRIRMGEAAARPLSMAADHVEVDLRPPDAETEAVATAASAPVSGADPRPAPKEGAGGDPAGRIQRQLEQVRFAAAWVDDPGAGGVVVEGEGFRGTCERAEWDGAKRVLRFSGRGVQSLILERARERKDEVQASEVICDWAANRIRLAGNVHGILYLDDVLRQKPDAGASPPEGKVQEKGIPLAYQADEVEVEVLPVEGGYDIGQVVASRHVQVENQSYQLKLSGHRLVYDAVRQFVLIDAPPEESPPDLKRGGPETCHVTAREMRVWRRAPEDPADRTSPGNLAVTFERDVTMYLTLERELGSPAGFPSQRVMVAADRVTFLFDPSRGASPQSSLIEARAEGNVVFSSGKYQGGADRAVYDGPRRQLILLGTQAPAWVHTPLQQPLPAVHRAQVLTLRNIGSSILTLDTRGGYEWKDLELPWQRNRIRLPSPGASGSAR